MVFSGAWDKTTTALSGRDAPRQMPLVPEKGTPWAMGTPSSRTPALSPLRISAPRQRRHSSAWVDLPVPEGAVKRMARP